MNTQKRLPLYRLPLPLTLLAAVLLAGCITVLALWCQPNAFRSVLVIFKAQPLLIVLNALPVGLILLALTCLTRNVFFGAALTNLLVCGFSIANRVKIEVRDEPVFPRDLALLKEVGVIVSEYDLHFPWTVIAVVLCATLVLIGLGILVRCRPFPLKWLRGAPGSLLGAAASIGVLAALILTVYASNTLYNSFKVSNAYYVPSVFNELGFPYCFCHQFTTYPVDKPEGYSKAQAEQWETAELSAEAPAEPVSVIMVMNEAFSDVTDYEAFAYTAENDPLPNYHALQSDPHAVTGHVVVPGFAAGTANTEFDVLTGIQTNALSATTTSAMRVVNRDLDSLFHLYGEAGYRTSYYHPGDDWFYNRENVLRWMGAEKTLFADEMEGLEYKGRWVTDESLVPFIMEEFDTAVADGVPLFHYMTTIQNHMSYTADKYGAEYDFPAVPLNIDVSDNVRTMLEVYAEGARDADAMLGDLRDYFAERSEPVVLVFFGDHLPYLGDNQLAYTELGMAEENYWAELISYETPYVIWANDAAAEALDWENTVSRIELTGGRLSAAFLGAAVVELTGYRDHSAWFNLLNILRLNLPVVQKQTLVTWDGTVLDASVLDGPDADIVEMWRQWSYYKLKHQEFDS